MNEQIINDEEFEDNRRIEFTQTVREQMVNSIISMNQKTNGVPMDQGQQILLMQSLDGLSSVSLKKKAMRQKDKENDSNAEILKGLASEMIRGMIGHSGKKSDRRTTPLTLDAHKQTYVAGELSTEQTVVDEAHIIEARRNLIPE